MRIRTVKPEFWSHAIMGRLQERTQLLALALLNHADDHGYFHADPAIVRGSCAPFREDLATIREDLARLSAVGWVDLREHPSQGQIGHVVNWTKHQKVDHPKPSKIEGYFIRENLAKVSDKLALDQGSGIREGKGKEAQKIGPTDEELDITSSKPLTKLPKTKLGLNELNSIPGLIVIAKDQQKLLTVLNEVGLDTMIRATKRCLEVTGKGYESNVTPIAYAMHSEKTNPPIMKTEPLPDNLNDLPIDNPLNPNYWKNKGSQQ